MNGNTVLITGISGFIANHCAVELLNAGYRVRGSLWDHNVAMPSSKRPSKTATTPRTSAESTLATHTATAVHSAATASANPS